MNDYDLLESDYSDEEETSFNEEYFTTYYLDNIFDLYYNIKNSMCFNPNIMSKSNISSFTTLIVDLLFNQQTLFRKYGKSLTYRENRFIISNKNTIDQTVVSIDHFVQFVRIRYGVMNLVSKDLIQKWVVRSSCLSRL